MAYTVYMCNAAYTCIPLYSNLICDEETSYQTEQRMKLKYAPFSWEVVYYQRQEN